MQSGDDDATDSMRSVIINTIYGFFYKLTGMKMTGPNHSPWNIMLKPPLLMHLPVTQKLKPNAIHPKFDVSNCWIIRSTGHKHRRPRK